MPELSPNEIHTVPIDSTGEIATIEATESRAHDATVGINIEGDAAASYEVYVGGDDGAGGIKWFDGGAAEATYTDSQYVSDGWRQSEQYIRVDVTTAAAAGNEARLYIARGT